MRLRFANRTYVDFGLSGLRVISLNLGFSQLMKLGSMRVNLDEETIDWRAIRENYRYGSEGGEVFDFPYPYRS